MADTSAISFAGVLACSAFAACFAEFCTIPLDTAKVRLQLQKRVPLGDSKTAPKYKGLLGTICTKIQGLLGTIATLAKEEGLFALWKGIIPGLHRQCLYGGLRIGFYEPVKAFFVGSYYSGDVPLFSKILAALMTGALAIAVDNPTDLVKIRLQAEGKLPVGLVRHYSGALRASYAIVKQVTFVIVLSGRVPYASTLIECQKSTGRVAALWKGFGPNIARNTIINAAELVSYDHVKETILKIPGFTDNVPTHILRWLGAGFFAVCIGSPVDVVKSKMMGDSVYKGTLDCFFKTLKNEGFFAFYMGFFPNFGRFGSWDVIMFLTLEQVKKFFN